MPVVIFIRDQMEPLIYTDADAATIVANGHLQLYKRGDGGPDQQLGGVFAGDWKSYKIVSEEDFETTSNELEDTSTKIEDAEEASPSD